MYFFLLSRPQPRSTLFPYTTLFRSVATEAHGTSMRRCADRRSCGSFAGASNGHPSSQDRAAGKTNRYEGGRSEEHTSELQSLTNLVCRLLLEKKKNTNIDVNKPKKQ